MTKLAQGLCLNLTDTLTGDIKLLSHLFQSSGTTVIQTKTIETYDASKKL